MLFQKSLKNGCKNIVFYPYTFDMSDKSFSYLTPFSRRGPVNLLTPFSAIAISRRQWQIKSLLGYLIKNYCNDLCLHLGPSKMFLKPNSYLMLIFRHGPENPSTTIFPISILQKLWQSYCLENFCMTSFFCCCPTIATFLL